VLAHGHRRIAYLGDIARTESHQDRYTGYVRALDKAGIPVDPALVWFGLAEEVSCELLTRLLALGMTALIAEHDRYARAVLRVATAMGLQVPDGLSLAALGDPVAEREPGPELTAFKIPRRRMGMQAVRLLVEMLKNPSVEPVQVTFACEFVPGATVVQPQAPPLAG
jgi:DNA-binding LacI/PurR family transcriptional regulator